MAGIPLEISAAGPETQTMSSQSQSPCCARDFLAMYEFHGSPLNLQQMQFLMSAV